MKAKIPEKLWKALGGEATFKHYGLDGREMGWQKYAQIDLEQITPKRLQRLAEMVEPHTRIKGAAMLLKDIKAWLRVSKKDQSVKPRTVEQFASLLTRHLLDVPGHRICERDEVSEVWLVYYVEDVTFHPEQRGHHGDRIPPSVSMDLFWEEFGKRRKKSKSFYAEDCLHLTVTEALHRKGFYIETEEMRREYLADVEKWKALVGKVGLQLLGRGIATDDLDGNGDKDRWSSYSKNRIVLDHSGDPARLVVDVFREEDKDNDRDRPEHIDLWFWSRKTMKIGTSEEEGEDDSNDDLNEEEEGEGTYRSHRERSDLPDEDVQERPVVEVPIHPKLACFDLRRHLRLRVHVGCVEVYQYDTQLAEKLVLPKDMISLVEILISTTSGFKDIVQGKGGGATILCAGPAGVGKTLTAEVYSEAKQRPLYTVQCSQLGTRPDTLEGELHKVFARAQRWNAILLLDEADVYVMARGNDLHQNAIVGVFLRVLEYFNGVLFMTTNRSDLVDDAIASRCIARIDYPMPPPEDQRRIWRILSDVAECAITPEVVEEILLKHNDLSGRDIKNLIKLAKAVSTARNEPITVETIDFVKRFKPTVSQSVARGKLVKGALTSVTS